MGQSGLMMGGGPAVAFAAPDPLSVALLVPVPVFGLVAFELWWHVGRPVPPRGTPGDVLRARCA